MAQDDDFGIPVHAFQKNARARVCIHVQEYKGSTFLDLREFYLDGDSGEWRPTRKGLTIPPDLYLELLQGVVTAADALGLEVPEELSGD